LKPDRVAYNVTEAFTSGADSPFVAAIAAVKACLFSVQPRYTYTPPLIFTFPAIVIDAPLFECFLDDNTGTVSVQQIEQAWWFVDFRLPEFSGTCIKVVSKAALPPFSAEVSDMHQRLRNLIADDVEREWQAFKHESEPPNAGK
jgi:hypothetical protein